MLNLNLKEGEYVTIGDDIVVQTFPYGSQTQVLIDAPREMTILRGTLRERSGDERPGSLAVGLRKPSPSDRRRSAARRNQLEQRQNARESARNALSEVRAMLDALGATPESAWLRERMERIAPMVE